MRGVRRAGSLLAVVALASVSATVVNAPTALASASAPLGRATSAALAPAPAALALDAPAASTSAAPLSSSPSKTQPYAACPPPARRRAACQAVVVPAAAKLSSLAPPALPSTGGINGSGLTPAELESAYELPSSTAGAGQTVALVDAFDDPSAESDLATYRSDYGLPPCTGESGCFRKVNQSGGTSYPPRPKAENGDWDLEESLDLDMVSAICPNCHILLVEAESNSFENLTTAESEAASLGATEISNSWASPEFKEETSFDAYFDHPGIPITAASGDDGYDNQEIGASAPSYPAVSPDVIAVGGTELAPAGNARGWSESVWPRSGSGCSLYEPKPSYQTDGGCAHRATNDVAAVAEDLSVYDTTHAIGIGGLPNWIAVGGTSAATPIVAAVEALSESAERSLGGRAFYESPGSLFDIVSGSNGTCAEAYLCSAGGGYDGPTGNGTPDGALSQSAPPPPPELSVRGAGTGSGSVGSSPAGIACPSACTASFAQGTHVTLTAAPAAGSSFEGWKGACAGTGPCTISLTAGASVTAVFRSPGTPAGWAEQTLSAPAGREPFLAETSFADSFYDVALSADGSVRAKTIYNPPIGFCEYATTNTGGVFLERRVGSSWVPEGSLTAPAVGSGSEAKWANCDGFGEVTKLSGDGSTLLVSQDMSPSYKCAAFVYRHGSGGWTLEGTLFPPGVGPSGSKTWEGCDYFGIEGATSDDGDRVAVMSDGRVDVFVREASGWSLEQHIVLPAGSGCTETIGPRKLALSGEGTTMLVGEPDCETDGDFDSGRVFAYTRSSSGWSLAQTIESPEPSDQNEFGDVVAVSDEGSTATIATGYRSAGLPNEAGSAWVYEHTAGGWQRRTRLTASTPEASGFDCPTIVAGGARIVCGANDTVGFNARQGSIYAFERPSGGWASSSTPERAFATYGFPGDDLGRSGELGWRMFAASDDGGVIDAPITAANIADGLYPDDLIGYEFTAAPVYAAPAITGFSPASGGAGTSVTVTGANLDGASAVSFDGDAASGYDAESPTQLTATVPAHASSGPITVTTPGGSATSAEGFTFVTPSGPPVVTSIAPSAGPTSGATAVTIKGANFVSGATVTIGGAASAVDVRSETEITAVTPAEPAGRDEVIVSDEAGSSSAGPTYRFVPGPPTVSSVAPSEGSTLGGTPVTIKGTGFLPGATVTIGGAASAVDVRSETEITAVTAAEPTGSDEVIVSDEGGSSSAGPVYTYVEPPSVSSITPSEGASKGHTKVTIRGAHFLAGATVTIGGEASSVRVRSETEITAKTPAEPAGSYEVVVSDSRGSSGGGPSYTYAGPVVSSITPAEGPPDGGTAVTIEGSGFLSGAKVKIGPKGQARSVRVVSETEITAVTRAEPPGSDEVVVSEHGGASAGGPAYLYTADPLGSALGVEQPLLHLAELVAR